MSEHIIETEISNGALFIPYQSKLSEAVREEIVRCRDCKFYSPEQPTEISGIFKVRHPAWCHKHIAKTKPNGFCAWSERKEGGDD